MPGVAGVTPRLTGHDARWWSGILGSGGVFKSIHEITRIFNEHGIQVTSHSKGYNIQVQRDDREAGRINTRAIRPLPKQAQFKPVGKRGERYL